MIDPRHDAVVRTYLHAKDGQRPHLFGRVFTPEATFTSRFVQPIDFAQDQLSEGLAAITDVFRGLGAYCENIYTLYADDSVRVADDGSVEFRWVVGMQERETGKVRVAWGDYRWRFTSGGDRATALDVLMEQMPVFEPAAAAAIFGWLSALPEPWCSSKALAEGAPPLPALDPLRGYFGGGS